MVKYDHFYILDNLIPNAKDRNGFWLYGYPTPENESQFVLVNTLTSEDAVIEELDYGYVVYINGKEVYSFEEI